MMNKFQKTAGIRARQAHQIARKRREHFLSNRHLHRRTFLGSAAAIIGLPYLDSAGRGLREARAADCAAAQRFLAWFLPCGIHMPDWTPTSTGQGWTAPYILEPLEPVRNKLMVVTGLDHHETSMPGEPPGGHGSGTGAFLTMRPVYQNENDPDRTSLDQVIAQQATSACSRPLPSLQLGPTVRGEGCDRTDCSFLETISWDKDTPLPMEGDPVRAFNRVFEGVDAGEVNSESDAEAERRIQLRTSVLDYVHSEAELLQVGLGQDDRSKLDDYLTGIRDLETRIGNLSGQPAVSCEVPGEPAQDMPYQDLVPVLADLMAMAFICDQTRVGSFIMARGTSMVNFEFLLQEASEHHLISHHMRQDRAFEMLREIGRWEMEIFSAFLQKLDAAVEADGTSVLDKTLVYCSSEIGDGNSHVKYDVPVITAGSANDRFKADGSHIMYTDMSFPRPTVGPRGGPNTGRLMVSMLNAFDIQTDSFGHVDGNLNDDFLI
jgi:hypothetical protein